MAAELADISVESLVSGLLSSQVDALHKTDEESDRNDIDDFLDSVMSTTPPSKPKAKKAPAKKAGSKPLADVANESFGGDGADDVETEAPTQTGAGDKYQKVYCRLLIIVENVLMVAI